MGKVVSVMRRDETDEDQAAAARAAVMRLLEGLNPQELRLVAAFSQQIIVCFDPDAVGEFLAWREDPRLSTVLQLASEMGDDALDQLVFTAEDLYAEERASRSGCQADSAAANRPQPCWSAGSPSRSQIEE